MHFSTLSEWLAWIGSIHTTEIDLGLDRVKTVAARLGILSFDCPIIIVGGTNGKGSTVAALEAIYRVMGYRVGAFTTPILYKHNEQVRLNGELASDLAFCQAFEKIEAVRKETSLTPFEFCTLAALFIFKTQPLDVLLLEVGLGGRLDAVNIMEPDLSIVTSIGIDHVDWLGPTRETIAYEKAGIFRPNKPAVCGDSQPPMTLLDHAAKLHVPLFCQGKDFSYHETATHWSWTYQDLHYLNLPLSVLAIQNMSTVLMAVTLLQDCLPVTREAIDKGLTEVKLTGRIEIVNGPITWIYDVSHNPDSVALLAQRLHTLQRPGKTYAIFSMLGDKDILASIQGIQSMVDEWMVAPLFVKRAAGLDKLKHAFQTAGIENVTYFSSLGKAYRHVQSHVKQGDRVLVFGSFHTVAEIRLNQGCGQST